MPMADVITILSIAGIIIVIGFLANVLFKKTNFPDTLFLVATGILFGPVLGIFQQNEIS